MGITDDPNHPDLKRGPDTGPGPQNSVYLVLSEAERAKGFTRPYRASYIHTCGTVTTMGRALAETYARDPHFYGYTYCCGCMMHHPVGQFNWVDDKGAVGETVGS